MYNNYQQPPPVYESLPTGSYTQPTFFNQYEQLQYANNPYMNPPSQPQYNLDSNQLPVYSISIQQEQYPPQPQYVDNNYMAQQQQQYPPQPQYVDNSYMEQQQQQYPPQPQYVDNSYMAQQSQPTYQIVSQQSQPIYSTAPQQSQPTYQTVPQQPLPYSTSVQPPPYSAPIQQQRKLHPNVNPTLTPKNPKVIRAPFSNGYKWPRKPVPLVCPNCGASVTTRLERTITIITIAAAVILLFFTCILALVPFCIPACKKSTHYCPHCNSILGERSELK